MQSSEFTKSLNLGKKPTFFLFFTQKLIFLDRKIFLELVIEYILIDLNNISSENKITIFVESHDEKTAKNDRKYYVAEKRIFSKLLKIYQYQILKAQKET